MGQVRLSFILYDLPDSIIASLYIFADDTKMFGAIRSLGDCNLLQDDLDRLQNWSLDKC